MLKDAVDMYFASKVTSWTTLDPHSGRGLTCDILRGISDDDEVLELVDESWECMISRLK